MRLCECLNSFHTLDRRNEKERRNCVEVYNSLDEWGKSLDDEYILNIKMFSPLRSKIYFDEQTDFIFALKKTIKNSPIFCLSFYRFMKMLFK